MTLQLSLKCTGSSFDPVCFAFHPSNSQACSTECACICNCRQSWPDKPKPEDAGEEWRSCSTDVMLYSLHSLMGPFGQGHGMLIHVTSNTMFYSAAWLHPRRSYSLSSCCVVMLAATTLEGPPHLRWAKSLSKTCMYACSRMHQRLAQVTREGKNDCQKCLCKNSTCEG